MMELNVENMTCGGCVRHVTKSVQSIDANAKVEVDLAAKRVRVDSGADVQAVVAAIADAGYPASVCAAN
jgi:copper chaperone CopZ